MNTLIINCSYGMSIYLLKDSKIYEHIDKNQKKHTDELLVVVDELLNKANVGINEIDNIGVCIGPGSFTGIRVAVSVCKGLSIGINAKIFVLDNFDVVSFGINEKSIYILDGFSNFVYSRVFNGKNNEDSCQNISDLINMIKTNYKDYTIYVESEKTQNILLDNQIQSKFIENHTINAFLDKIKNNETTLINQISPIYLRASQAEIERNEKLKKDNQNV